MDIRIDVRRAEDIQMINNNLKHYENTIVSGYFIRIFLKRCWGYASSTQMNKDAVMQMTEKAFKMAKSALRFRSEKKFIREKSYTDSYVTPFRVDPFTVSPDEKKAVLSDIYKNLCDFRLKLIFSNMYAEKQKKVFASTEGSRIDQEILWCGVGVVGFLDIAGIPYHRSFPATFGGFPGSFQTGGYETIEELDLAENVSQIGHDLTALKSAHRVPSGRTKVLLEGSLVALLLHETFGHQFDADTACEPHAVEGQIGSDQITILADATAPRGLGTYGYDDEGVPAKRLLLLDKGQRVGTLVSRGITPLEGVLESSGVARAACWSDLPLIRMSNLILEKGDQTTEELISDIHQGVFLIGNKNMVIEKDKSRFDVEAEYGYRIEGGELKTLIRRPVISIKTTEFWLNCTAVSKDHWHMWGLRNCAKGSPPQLMHIGHGVAPCSFDNVCLQRW
jgi:TldD protein